MRSWDEVMRDAGILYDFLSQCDEGPERADIILAAGSHDLRVAEYAAVLFKEGCAPLVVCSGGLGKVTDELWDTPEGVLFARRCVELGVPEDCVLIEREARNTGENFTLSRKLMEGLGIRPASGMITCKPYMARRAWATATRQWENVKWSVRVQGLSLEEYLDGDMEPEREINLMVGDLQRMKVYAEKGYQSPVEVPEEIWGAYGRLAEDGFDKYVIK